MGEGIMIPEIKKILYTTDLSPNSAYAFRYAVGSAKRHDAEIILLHVLEQVPDSVRALLADYLSEEQQQTILEEKLTYARERIQKRLKIFAEKELQGESNVLDRISIEVEEGHPADVILQKADELHCDIVVMGTHGKETWHHTYLGSMARRVLGRIRKPVFIIPLPSGETDITFHDI